MMTETTASRPITPLPPPRDIPSAAGTLEYLPGAGGVGNSQLAQAGFDQTLAHMDGPFAYRTAGGLRILVSRDHTHHGPLLHVSISRADRYPSWGELKAVREALFPDDVDCMQVLPRKGMYVNVHPNCFHIIEMPVAWGIL